ncbi:type IV pilin protein [Candidatus Avelusimicrobium caledoniensis]|uniref:type IV pilin protein n=1 Tax=Candidatus Avelusimicrobium caledoniensis TaxID=3416220 RepID=UPI003D0EA5ED
MKNKQAFMLIELLVVVLIIGILAAVALPQYQKAVEKARAATIFPLLKAVGEAQENYYLANGTYATSFDDLTVDIPFNGTEKWATFYGIQDTRSNKDWSIQLFPGINAVFAGRLTGPYAGAGFAYFYGSWGCGESGWCVPPHTLTCTHNVSYGGVTYTINAGRPYCAKLFKAITQVQAGGGSYYYAMP